MIQISNYTWVAGLSYPRYWAFQMPKGGVLRDRCADCFWVVDEIGNRQRCRNCGVLQHGRCWRPGKGTPVRGRRELCDDCSNTD